MLTDGGTADDCASFADQRRKAGSGEVGSRDQAIVAAADDYYVPAREHAAFSPSWREPASWKSEPGEGTPRPRPACTGTISPPRPRFPGWRSLRGAAELRLGASRSS